jgi:hypothetical protein
MNPPQLATVAVTVGVVLVVAMALGVRAARVARRRWRAQLDAARADVDALRARLDALESSGTDEQPPSSVGQREFVITTLPEGRAPLRIAEPMTDAESCGQPGPLQVSAPTAAQFATVAVGESLVRLVSLAYGVRRALSAKNRNRIRFEMRHEVKRARRQRRRDLKEAKRHLRHVAAGSAEDAA